MIITLILIILNRFILIPLYLNIGLLLIISIVFYVIGVILLIKAIVIDFDLERNHILKAWDFSYRYYSNLGIALFSGGIIALFTSTYWQSSLGISIVGITSIILGEYKRGRIDRFREDYSG